MLRLLLSVVALLTLSEPWPPHAQGAEFTAVAPLGCCRPAAPGAADFTRYTGSRYAAWCEDMCAADASCAGYEASAANSYCELHRSAPSSATSNEACTCFVKDPSADGVQQQDAPAGRAGQAALASDGGAGAGAAPQECVAINQDSPSAELRCAAGSYIGLVSYVSFGNGDGTCDVTPNSTAYSADSRSFARGTCEDYEALEYVEQACLAKSACTLSLEEAITATGKREPTRAGIHRRCAASWVRLHVVVHCSDFVLGAPCEPEATTCAARCGSMDGVAVCGSDGIVALAGDGGSREAAVCYCDDTCGLSNGRPCCADKADRCGAPPPPPPTTTTTTITKTTTATTATATTTTTRATTTTETTATAATTTTATAATAADEICTNAQDAECGGATCGRCPANHTCRRCVLNNGGTCGGGSQPNHYCAATAVPTTPTTTTTTTTTKATTTLATSAATCQDLGWDVKAAQVCGRSEIAGVCHRHKNVSFSGAKGVCESVGARLCTLGEIQSRVTEGTGCALDYRTVWTSTGCTKSGSSASAGGWHYIAHGDGRAYNASELDRLCRPDAPTQSVRCCADAADSTTSSTPEATPHRASTQPLVANPACTDGVLSRYLGSDEGFVDSAGVFQGRVCCPSQCRKCGGKNCQRKRGDKWPMYPNGYKCCIASYFAGGPVPDAESRAPSGSNAPYLTFTSDPGLCLTPGQTMCKTLN